MDSAMEVVVVVVAVGIASNEQGQRAQAPMYGFSYVDAFWTAEEGKEVYGAKRRENQLRQLNPPRVSFFFFFL